MAQYDVWLYAVTIEADDACNAEIKVQKILDEANISDLFQVDYAEEIYYE